MTIKAAAKLVSLEEAIRSIPDGSAIALGGNTMHRSPCAAVPEFVRQGKTNLTLIKTAGSYDVDLLCGAGCVDKLVVAYVGFENLHGLAPQFRGAIEQGRVVLEEQTCPTVIAALRAAAQGIPFMPIAGMTGSDLVDGRFRRVENPYGEGTVVTVPALWPDWAVIHVQEADMEGNARIEGSHFEDVLMVKAARHVLLTCETLVASDAFVSQADRTTISGFQVAMVVHAPNGAWPASCAGHYPFDDPYLSAYYQAAQGGTPELLRAFLRTHGAFAPAGDVPTANRIQN